MNHTLALEIPDTLNTKYLRIIDFSEYDSNIPVECQLLEVTPPGFLRPVQFGKDQIEPGFVLNLSACNLGLQQVDCNRSKLDLVDGIYVVKYSVSPHDAVYVEYNYFKVSCLMNRYKNILCSLPLDGTEPVEESNEKLRLLSEAKMYIEAAKAKAEVCHDPKKAVMLYDYAKKILSKFDCVNC